MQFKKLAAIAGSALVTGLSIAAPVLATSVTQVKNIGDLVSITDSTVSFPILVVGDAAKTADVAGAVNIAVMLAGKSKTAIAIAGTEGAESVTGGVKLRTPGNEFTLWETNGAQGVKAIITSSDLASLKDQTYQTTQGSGYTYKQYLYIGGDTTNTNTFNFKFSRPTTENAPRVNVHFPINSKAYTYKITFSTPVSWTAEADLEGTTMSLFGKDFVISDVTRTTNQISDITLLGGKNIITVKTAEDKTAIVAGKDYTVHLDAVAQETIGGSYYYSAVGNVNEESFTLRAGQTMTMSDGTRIAAIKVFQGKTGEADYAKIAIGAEKVKITSAGTVSKEDKTVTDLTASFTQSASSWNALKIDYTPATEKFLNFGGKVPDLFTSAFDIVFNSIYPTLDDTTNRQTITITPSAERLLLTYKNAAGEEKQVPGLYYDSPTWRWADAVSLGLAGADADNNIRDLVFDEYKNISSNEQDYFVIQKGGFSHVMRFTAFAPGTSELTFVDEAGNAVTSTNTSATAGTLIVDGNSYTYTIVDATKKIVTMDLNADGTSAGGVSTLGAEYSFHVPKLITSGQGGLYFYMGNKTSSTTAGSYVYPALGFAGIRWGATGGDTSVFTVNVSTYSSGLWPNETSTITLPTGGTLNNATYVKNYIDYVVNCQNTSATSVRCNVALGTTAGTMQTDTRGFILVEEAIEGAATHNWIFFPAAYDSTYKSYVSTTLVSDDSNFASTAVSGTATQYKAMSTYGTHVEHLTANIGGSATIKYPDTFTYANIYVLGPDGVISTTGVTGATTADKILPVTSDIVKLDTEVTDKTTNDFIIVGGPCVNKLAAEALNKTYPACGAASGIPENAALIKLVKDAFTTGKTALLVAGWEAADTDFAARVIQDGTALATHTESEVKVTGTDVKSPTISAV